MIENTTDAYVLNKSVYKEYDYIVSLFTKDFGKISSIAKNAKKSIKRFGGRLEQFSELQIKFKTGMRKINYLEDVSIYNSYQNIIGNYDRFKWGSFVLEYIDNLTEKEETNINMYNLLKNTLENLDANYGVNDILSFQYRALKCVGLNPNLTSCYKCGNKISEFGYLSSRRGGMICSLCFKKVKLNVPAGDVKFVLNFSNNDKKVIINNISLLTRFTKYHTGKEFKSEKFVTENKQ